MSAFHVTLVALLALALPSAPALGQAAKTPAGTKAPAAQSTSPTAPASAPSGPGQVPTDQSTDAANKPAVTPPLPVADDLGLVLGRLPFPTAPNPEVLVGWAVQAREEMLAALIQARVRRDAGAAARLNLRLQDLRRHVWSEVRRLRGEVGPG